MKMRIILAAALVGIIGCDRDAGKTPATQPSVQSASTASTAPSSSTDPRKHLADSFAHLWDLMQKEHASHTPVEDWARALADAKSPQAIAARRYQQATLVLLPPDSRDFYEYDGGAVPTPPKDLHAVESSYKYVTIRARLIDEILTKNQPDFGKRWTSGEFKEAVQAYGFGTLDGHTPLQMPTPAEDASVAPTTMSKEQATQACVDFILMLSRQVLEPGLQTIRLREQIGKAGDALMLQELPAVYSLSFDQWFAGQGPKDLDMPADLKKLLVQYHPEIAGPVMELIDARMVRGIVGHSQRRVKSDLGMIAKAEHDYVDRIIDENDGYWTADVSGLFRAQLNGRPIALLPIETARLDVHPANLPIEAPLPAPSATEPVDNLPKYAIAAVPVPSQSHFAFCAYPIGYGRVGRQSYLLTDVNKLWVKDTDGKAVERLPDDLEADGWTTVEPGEDRELSKMIPAQGPLAQLKDPDPAVRTAALKRIVGIEGENGALVDLPCGHSPAALRAIANALDDDNHFVRREAIERVRQIGKPILADAEPVILKCLNSDPSAPVNEELGDKRSDAVEVAVALELKSDSIKACYRKLSHSTDPNLAQAAAHALGIAVPNTPHFEGYWVATDDETAIASEVSDARAADAPVIRIFGQIFDETAIRSVAKGDGIQGPLVVITMTDQGAKKLQTETAARIGRKMAMLVDGKVYAILTVQAALGGRTEITGMEEAEVQRIVKAFANIQKINEEWAK